MQSVRIIPLNDPVSDSCAVEVFTELLDKPDPVRDKCYPLASFQQRQN
jgi:hypothetical protein